MTKPAAGPAAGRRKPTPPKAAARPRGPAAQLLHLRAATPLRGIFDALSEGLVTQDLGGTIVDANPAAERILGLSRDQLLGRTSRDPTWRAIRADGMPFPGDEHPAMQTLRTGRPVRDRIMGIESDPGGRRWIRVNTVPVRERRRAPMVGVVSTFVDVTDERNATAALHAARDELQRTVAQLRAITNSIPMSIVLYDAEHRIVFANEQYRRLGRPGVVAEGTLAQDFLPPTIRVDTDDVRRRAFAGEPARMTVTSNQPSGPRVRQLTFTPYADADGRIVGVIALGYDVTELEQSRARFREAVERLATVRESERHEIAIALHEGPAQDLYAARLGVERLRNAARSAGDVAALNDIHAIIEQAVREIGALTRGLYPTALAHLPLADVVTQHAETFRQRSGLQVRVDAATALPELAPEVKLLFFRAAQEALTNVWRHARATRVQLTLKRRQGAVWLVVEDDGVGLPPGSDAKVGSLGLLAMRERFHAAGGGLKLGASKLGGASVAVWAAVPAA